MFREGNENYKMKSHGRARKNEANSRENSRDREFSLVSVMYQAGRLPDEHVFKGGLGLYETDYFQAFKKAELGAWVEKPMEQDEFETKTE